MLKEIGSEYWLSDLPRRCDDGQKPDWLEKWPNAVLTSSGRGAISLVIKSVACHRNNHTVFLPSYCCRTMIDPFAMNGYTIRFYDIQKDDLIPVIRFLENFARDRINIFLHMGYFGFRTNKNLTDILAELKNRGAWIVEDITHTLFSGFETSEHNDFHVASIRKWIGIPGGGLFSAKKPLSSVRLKPENTICRLRMEALRRKAEYMRTGDEHIRPFFSELFKTAEDALDEKPEAYAIDAISNAILNQFRPEGMIGRRRENYRIVEGEIRNNKIAKTVFNELPDDVCPMFLPLYVDGRRDDLRKALVKNKIYAPVHWPKPVPFRAQHNPGYEMILTEILSIPIDQRYGPEDMARIGRVVNSFSSSSNELRKRRR